MVSRSIALLYPFYPQKIRPIIISVVIYLFTLIAIDVCLIFELDQMNFYDIFCKPDALLNILINYMTALNESENGSIYSYSVEISDRGYLFLTMHLINNIVPAVTVISSFITSLVLFLKARSATTQQQALRRSRNRATVTVLIFGVVFAVCNGFQSFRMSFLCIFYIRGTFAKYVYDCLLYTSPSPRD